MTKTKVLPDFPDDMSAPDILRSLAAWLDRHPDVQPDSIDLTSHSSAARDAGGQDVMDVFVERYGATVSTSGMTRWADLYPPRGNDGRRIKVEVTVFGSRSPVEAKPVACSPECQAQPEERPCLDDCPAQVAARNS
jgi:hypothetical protein